MSKISNHFLLLALLGAAVSAAPGCAKKDRGAPRRNRFPSRSGPPRKQDVPLELRAIGHVEPFSTVALKARVGGEVTKVGFKEGEDVRKGDLLFQIDPRPYEAALAQARAQLERDSAMAKWSEDEVKRYADLVQKDYVTREQFDSTRSNAAASLATVKADEAAVENARLQLSYCTVTAPISARAGSVLVYPGNQVKGNDDKPLVVLNQIQPVFVSFAVPESSLAAIRRNSRPGQRLAVSASPAGNPGGRPEGRADVSGQRGRFHDGHDPAEGDVLESRTRLSGRACTWTSCSGSPRSPAPSSSRRRRSRRDRRGSTSTWSRTT